MTQSRRRFLQISAAASLAGLSTRARAQAPTARWSGAALGAASSISIAGLPQSEADEVFAQVSDEITRLERIFSLYDPGSDLSRLNRDGALAAPEFELLEVLSLSRQIWSASQGAFDPSVQPILQARFSEQDPSLVRHSHSLSDVTQDGSRIILAQAGMGLTLNGIAQGYITDQVTRLLARQGLKNVAVNAGETRALGRPDASRAGWHVGVADPNGRLLARHVLNDRAIATSASRGTLLPDGQSHLIDARNGQPLTGYRVISIAAPTATLADGLSTAASCLSRVDIQTMLQNFPDAELLVRSST
ncbi:FAD:protein FMN transferase [Primorskyibacter sp. S187A]|uniref:FAD:protein FMN transferase n=1 Tax=Primorskyibacter sp. S187A TaxID=3415130 RepID=UPI003C7A236D